MCWRKHCLCVKSSQEQFWCLICRVPDSRTRALAPYKEGRSDVAGGEATREDTPLQPWTSEGLGLLDIFLIIRKIVSQAPRASTQAGRTGEALSQGGGGEGAAGRDGELPGEDVGLVNRTGSGVIKVLYNWVVMAAARGTHLSKL